MMPLSSQNKKKADYKLRHIPKSDEHRLIIPYVTDHFEIREYPEEQLEKRLPREKLAKMLKELDALIEQMKVQVRKKWKIFVGFVVLLIAILVSFIVIVIAYGGGETGSGSIESGKKGVASVFIIITLMIGFGWMVVGAKRARDILRIVRILDEMNRRRGIKIYNLFLKFGDHMEWIELYYDFKGYKAHEDKKKRERELLLHGKITKRNTIPAYVVQDYDDEKTVKKGDLSISKLDDERLPEIQERQLLKDRMSLSKLPELSRDTALSNSFAENEVPQEKRLEPFILKKVGSDFDHSRVELLNHSPVEELG